MQPLLRSQQVHEIPAQVGNDIFAETGGIN